MPAPTRASFKESTLSKAANSKDLYNPLSITLMTIEKYKRKKIFMNKENFVGSDTNKLLSKN